MVRWRERCRAAKAAPFPDHVPKGASTANKWAYIHVSPAHGVLWIELKAGTKQSDAQIAFQQQAEKWGDRYIVAKSVDDVLDALEVIHA